VDHSHLINAVSGNEVYNAVLTTKTLQCTWMLWVFQEHEKKVYSNSKSDINRKKSAPLIITEAVAHLI